MGRQSEQSSAHEVSDGVGSQEDCEPHDERDTKQPEAGRGVSVDPFIEVGELVLQHGSVPLHERECSINSGFGASIDALFLRGRGILVVA